LAAEDCSGLYLRITHTDGVAGAESGDVYIAGVCDRDNQVSRAQITGVTNWNLALTNWNDVVMPRYIFPLSPLLACFAVKWRYGNE
jgi:hypothetical protein